MPYKSDAQRRFFHSQGAKKAGISEETVKEFDKETKGRNLPERADNDDNKGSGKSTDHPKEKSRNKETGSRGGRKGK